MHTLPPNIGAITGRGMFPISETMQRRYFVHSRAVLMALSSGPADASIEKSFSEVKGMCNRVWREDQADWVDIWLRMGVPERRRLNLIALCLSACRAAFLDDDIEAQVAELEKLERLGLRTILTYFLGDEEPHHEDDDGYLLLLSDAAARDHVTVGHTGHDVRDFALQLNRKRWPQEPLGVRRMWKVRNPEVCMNLVRERLREFSSNELGFFDLGCGHAEKIVDQLLAEHDEKVQLAGRVIKVFQERGYAFIESDGLSYFLHAKECRDFDALQVGAIVRFDKLDQAFGLAAANVRKIATTSTAEL